MSERISDLLAVERSGPDRFRAEPRAGHGFLYGGLTMGVGMVIAARTVGRGLIPKSMRTAFVSFGRWGPLDVDVETVSSTRSFANRRLRLTQDDRTVAVADVSFHRPEEGTDRQARPAPEAPDPEELSPLSTYFGDTDPVDLRPVRPVPARPGGRVHPYWGRVRETLDADPAAHAAALAFVSDYMVIYSPFDPAGDEATGLRSFTLEHCLWFHRPFAADQWILYDAVGLTQSGGRYLSRGSAHDRRGRLVASFVQEGLIRPA